jgi:Bacterial phosphonate metabolism protein (PhnH)
MTAGPVTADPGTAEPGTAEPGTGGPGTAGPGTAGPGTGGGSPASAARGAGLPTALTPGGAQAVFRATLDALARPGTVRRLPAAAAEPLAARVPAALLPLLALADLSTPACVVGDEARPAATDDQGGEGGTGNTGGTEGTEGARGVRDTRGTGDAEGTEGPRKAGGTRSTGDTASTADTASTGSTGDVGSTGSAGSRITGPESSARRDCPARRDSPVSPDAAAGAASAGDDYGQVAWDEVVRVATNAPRSALAQARLVAALRPLSDGELASLRTGSATAPEDGALACLAVAGIAIVEGAPPVSGRGDSDQTAGRASAAGVSSRPGDVQHRSDPRADWTSDDAATEGNGARPSGEIDHGTSATRALMTGHDDEQGHNGRAAPAAGRNRATEAPRITGDDADRDHAGPSAPASGTGDHNAAAERTSAGPRADAAGDPADGTADGTAGGTGVRNGGTRLLLRLSGPGVPGTRAIVVTGLPAGFAAARERLVAGFPAGADLLLVAPDGAMTGLPRTTVVREEAC